LRSAAFRLSIGDLTGLVGSPDLSVWLAVLLIQSIPYAAAVFVSLVSALNLPGLAGRSRCDACGFRTGC